MMNFEFMPNEQPSIIKVIGVGGGGSNAVNFMYKLGIKGVDFVVCNTDLQALEMSPVPRKVQLGPSLTEGRGAGSMPEVGKQSAIENIEELKAILKDNTKMVFITAGMGGGTGTGAAPIIAGIAKEMGILTVGIVTVPFAFEGRKRKLQADLGIEELKRNVDTLLIICNDKLREIHGNLKLTNAFGYADNVLATAAKSIAEVISVTLHINVDFADVETVMRDSGVAIMGSAISSGDNRAIHAAELALDSPLLNDNNIEGARYILLNITSGNDEITMDEMSDITEYIQQKAGQSAEIIMGVGTDESLGDKIAVTIIATGFKTSESKRQESVKKPEVIKYDIYKASMPDVTNEREEENQLSPVASDEPMLKTIEEEVPITSVDYFSPENTKEPEPELLSQEFTFTDFPNVVTHELTEDQQEDILESSPVNEIPQPVLQQKSDTFSQEQHVQDEVRVKPDDVYSRTRERLERMKQMPHISSPQVLNDMEREPAYKRKNVKLSNVLSSDDTNYSRLSLNDEGPQGPDLKNNNKFLHDKAD